MLREILHRIELSQCEIDFTSCKPRTVRFWRYHSDGYVKLTLHPGQVIRFICGGSHDEGYSFSVDEFRHVGPYIELISTAWGRDCDGPRSDSVTSICNPSDLMINETYESYWQEPGHDPAIRLPQWRSVESVTFDQFAEMSGY